MSTSIYNHILPCQCKGIKQSVNTQDIILNDLLYFKCKYVLFIKNSLVYYLVSKGYLSVVVRISFFSFSKDFIYKLRTPHSSTFKFSRCTITTEKFMHLVTCIYTFWSVLYVLYCRPFTILVTMQ